MNGIGYQGNNSVKTQVCNFNVGFDESFYGYQLYFAGKIKNFIFTFGIKLMGVAIFTSIWPVKCSGNQFS
jgi:hypothetical protein